jgi:hypothetical protein
LTVAVTGVIYADQPSKDHMYYYQQGDLAKAADLAEQQSEQPLGRLVLSLCRIHDLDNQDIQSGLLGLKELFEDSGVDPLIRLEAKLSYTRTIQLLQVRGRHKQYDSVNVEELFSEVIEDAGDDERACYAALYLTEYHFESYLESNDKAEGHKAIDCIEQFLADYTGSEKNTVFLHLYAEKMYTNITEDYAKSLMHLEAAYRIGLTVVARQSVLFKLGRINDIKLNDKEAAVKYYKEYLRLYPYVTKTPLVKRYLGELEEK